ncbi:Cyclic di-GMP phosphodiesterase YfgF [Rickettsiales bacterium Ac37b]|nr:Cyclic di-GMP phosphodiesterase YfgF [Rickettsiales bacterium Ac37b]
MLECHKSFIQQLQNVIEFDINNHNFSSLLVIEIKNMPILITLYNKEFVYNALHMLKQDLFLKLNQLHQEQDDNSVKSPSNIIINVNDSYIYIIIHTNLDEIGQYVYALYNYIQLFSYNNDLKPLHFTPNISGISIPHDASSAIEALNKAYTVLNTNNNFTYSKYYTSYKEFINNKEHFKRSLILTSCIKKALLEQKLRLAFQPIIESKTGNVTHYESLLRIINNEGRIVSAGPFIEQAEEMGFISFIDEAVLEMVVEELKTSPNIHLAFNLSALGIHNENWLKKTKKLLQDSSLANRVIVEITETAAQKDLSKTAYFIATLQEIGCQVALDDFGSGYTSFRQLKALSVDIIKIDGAFIRDILDHSDNLLLVKTLLNMIRGFGLKSVAEFVENGEIAKLLMDLNVDYMQGNYFCPAVNYRSWIQNHDNYTVKE